MSSLPTIRVKTKTINGHMFTPVVFGRAGLHRLSQRESKFIKCILETGSLDMAADEVGIARKAAKRYSERKSIQKYLRDMMEQKALAQGLTLEKLMARLNQAIDGTTVMSEGQLDAIKIASRILRPDNCGSSGKSVSVTVNQQNNFNGPSPYSALSREELLADLKSALSDGEKGGEG